MLLRRFYDPKLAQASYLVGCQATGEALVVDPNRDAAAYLAAAEAEEMHVRWVAETHIHADYLSGSRELARRTGAELLLSGDAPEEWRYRFAEEDGARLVHDGDELELGKVRIRVLHTPGHTPEHVCFEITDGAASDEPMGILTGDFLFVGDVGRPDLLEKAAGVAGTMEEGARQLWASLERFRGFADWIQILPGHGAGSACGKALGAVPTSTLGYEKLVGWAFRCRSEEEFVERVLEDQPEPPTYFARMKRLNRDGPPLLDGLPRPARLGPDRLEGALEEDGVVVDIRPREAYAEGHVPGTINIPLNDSFPTWAGWFLPYDRPVRFVARDQERADEAARDLALIGIDGVAGWFGPDALERWTEERGDLQEAHVLDWTEAEREVSAGEAVLVDVRRRTEWNEGHVPGARHIHLGELPERAGELPTDRRILLYCRTGARSGIATSLLQAAGRPRVANVEGGVVERAERGLPLEPEGG